ncbi:MAG: transposase [Bryobacteraceae bacterium]
MRENFTYGSMRGCWRRSYGADCDTGVTAKAAGQPKPPFLWPPRQRPTLQRRNVLDHLTDEHKPAVAKRLHAAYALEDYAAAKQALNALHRELMDLNPSAARSLGEGMEETLTVHRLHVPMQLRKTLASTNVIESAFSIVEQVCKNVKRWHGGDQRERWVGSGLLVAQKQFRKVTGHKQIPALIRELEALVPSKSEIVKRRKAS